MIPSGLLACSTPSDPANADPQDQMHEIQRELWQELEISGFAAEDVSHE